MIKYGSSDVLRRSPPSEYPHMATIQKATVPVSVPTAVLPNLKRLLNQCHLNDSELFPPHVVYAYNTSLYSATGQTPHFVTYFQDSRTPSDIIFGPLLTHPLAFPKPWPKHYSEQA